ncbi:KH domain-containing protein [Candidatus Saccharibacteria bacterium]|nr:KH domain-containing protein [Candidatus Saccharibacteria bacterium]
MDREASIAFAEKYLSDILAFFGLNVAVSVTCEEDVIELSVPSTHLNGFLIGQHGATLKSLQMIIGAALRSKDAELQRVTVDIANYRRHHAEKLEEQAREWCRQVVESGEAMHLAPMNPADRRVVHQVIGEYPSLSSESEGEGRTRHVVILPHAK